VSKCWLAASAAVLRGGATIAVFRAAGVRTADIIYLQVCLVTALVVRGNDCRSRAWCCGGASRLNAVVVVPSDAVLGIDEDLLHPLDVGLAAALGVAIRARNVPQHDTAEFGVVAVLLDKLVGVLRIKVEGGGSGGCPRR
jgi:hypothetical protein